MNSERHPIKTVNIDVHRMYEAIDEIRARKAKSPYGSITLPSSIDYDFETAEDLSMTTIAPYNTAIANFYTYEKLDDVILSVECDERIRFFSHTKIFSVHMIQQPQDFGI